MGIMVYSSLWVMQDLYHQPYVRSLPVTGISPSIRSPSSALLLLHNLPPSPSMRQLYPPSSNAKRWKGQDGPSGNAWLGAVGETELLRDDISGQWWAGKP